ncbi:MAG: amidohydrolase [Deltaproteobacteria bacterium]|nr:amidohydrolase [Deltaproteobacteria bacterium]
MNMAYDKKIDDYIESRKDLFIDVNDKIWEFSELGYDEEKSADLLNSVLVEEGFTVQKDLAGMQTALIGSFGSGSPVIAILGEYDALSGLSQEKCIAEKKVIEKGGSGHGCGHNSLGAGALAACFAVKKYLEENDISGTVRFYGCPAEEGGSGKGFLARDGFFDDVDVALTWHPGSLNGVWSASCLAVVSAYFKFTGKSAHAAANPHAGRSALDAVELMNVGANYLREHVIPEARLHYAITDTGGIAPNVVQPEAEVYYFVRAPKLDQVQGIYERVCDIAKGAALMTGTTLEIDYEGGMSHYLPNSVLDAVLYENLKAYGPPRFDESDREFALEMRKTFTDIDLKTEISLATQIFGMPAKEAAQQIEGKELADFILPYLTSNIALPGSTDVGDVSLVVPTSQFSAATLAIGTPGHSWQTVSQSASTIAHKGLLAAGKVLAGTAIDIFNEPQIVAKAKEQHQIDMAGEPYNCPIPADRKPGVKEI